jgi:hypothetical protein
MAGCTDTSYVLQSGDDKVNAGVYIYNMLSEMSYQMTMMYYNDGITEDYFDQEIDGQSFSDYLSDYALTSTKEYFAIVKQFDSLGLELTSDELDEINENVTEAWDSYGDFYESEGISKDSMKLAYKESQMRSDLFDYYYAEGGVEEVSNSDIVTYLNDNYVRYKSISIAKSTNEDEDTAASEDEENKALRDEYLEKAEGVSFDDFDTIIDEYNAYLEEVAAEEAAAEDTSSDDSSTDSETDSTADSETDSSTDSSADSEIVIDDSAISFDAAATEDSTTDDSSVASDDSEASDDSTADDSTVEESDSEAELITVSADGLTDDTEDTAEGDSSTEEVDPYENETMYNFGTMDDDTKESSTGEFITAVNDLEVGVATAYEDDDYYYIIIKGDITERSTEYAEDNKDSMISEMKSDDFQSKIDGWVEEIGISENSDAIKRYTPQVVYDKQEEYYSSES